MIIALECVVCGGAMAIGPGESRHLTGALLRTVDFNRDRDHVAVAHPGELVLLKQFREAAQGLANAL